MKQAVCHHTKIAALLEYRNQIFDEAGVERLHRKAKFITRIYEENKKEWYQTGYMIFMRSMDASDNKEVFLRLARFIPYNVIMREASSLLSIEALLIGGSGLLEICSDDKHIKQLKAQWAHLSHKYNLTALHPAEWTINKTRPHNHPILRLAQIAMTLHKREFLIDRILECVTPQDVVDLFSIEASEYWNSQIFTIRSQVSSTPKRLGKEKSFLLGINLVVQLQFAYSFLIGKSHLRDRAFALLEKIPAENNRYIRSWQQLGVEPVNAFESQAIIQIVTEYCQKGRCNECFLTKYANKR